MRTTEPLWIDPEPIRIVGSVVGAGACGAPASVMAGAIAKPIVRTIDRTTANDYTRRVTAEF
jgi:hypothetical protein